MSGKPFPGGVAKVIDLIQRIEELQDEEYKLKVAVKKLSEVKEQIDTLDRELAEKLKSMDVDSPGNYGWIGRFSWLIAEVMRQVEKGRHPHQSAE